ncbi:peptidylprolyl isomerase [Govanella unica]|uniref:Peptidyl-prolyl cis-trans isomerase n=1 Tax=Govanella unica TaxID=2975056 RepID=A0A9X3TX13_9PROT|nr:peptidylprolyl isomerase [Govania unica]
MDAENILVLELKDGIVLIELYPQDAPNSVARVKELARKGFYNGLTFHRVIEGFMAQTGDPKGDGSGGSGQSLKAEFNDRMHLRGVMSMARADDVNSADSQFFICFRPNFALDHKYTVVGRVVSGMEAVDKIKRGEGTLFVATGHPDKILSLKVAADVPGVTVAGAETPETGAAPQ